MNLFFSVLICLFILFVGFLLGIAGVYNLIIKRKYFFWSGKKYIVLEESDE